MSIIIKNIDCLVTCEGSHKKTKEEMNDAKNALKILGGEVERIEEVTIEGSDLNHNLVVIKKFKETPKKYPRKAGMVTKNPLR